jgi:hypothetical protein
LEYFADYEPIVEQILGGSNVRFSNGLSTVEWRLQRTDFPSLLRERGAEALPKPHVIQFDPWSPARNPAMWTAALFADLFALLDPARGCVLATYSRSTMLRVALLLAGFWVGSGAAAGPKEETTVAANQRGLIQIPLDSRWLERARRSDAAEPLCEPIWRRAPLTAESWARLRRHPQFL